jgi:hypothetical protein
LVGAVGSWPDTVHGCQVAASDLFFASAGHKCFVVQGEKKLKGRRIEISDLFRSSEELSAEAEKCTEAVKSESIGTIPAWRQG